VKVLLVDDHTLVRKGLAQVLSFAAEDAEVSEASSSQEALELLHRVPQDVALVDIRMPGRDGLDLLKEIKETWPTLPVIILTSFDNAEYVRRALADGASGYLLKDALPEDLSQAITVALSGAGNVLSPRAVRNLFEGNQEAEQKAEAAQSRSANAGLTKRETDIMALLAEGLSNRDISKKLFLSEKTVKAHLAAVFRKLGVSNRTQAAMAAVSMGMGPGPSPAQNGWGSRSPHGGDGIAPSRGGLSWSHSSKDGMAHSGVGRSGADPNAA
jgi:DNA-binding NarL/FixJ family response regulator